MWTDTLHRSRTLRVLEVNMQHCSRSESGAGDCTDRALVEMAENVVFSLMQSASFAVSILFLLP